MKNIIGGLLAPFSDFMFTIINAIPLWVVRAFVFGILLALAVWVFRMSPQLPAAGEKKSLGWLQDLRVFAIAVLMLQAALYIIF
ncbi:MAG: hypothetical protein JXB48_11500 [Candidatus Latescibacteria bacterium]|nr:hypothetical protein [Candidatus Latescibacterota bacterium]